MDIRRFKVNKLVRDEIVNIMQKSGMIVQSTILSDSDYSEALKMKLIEEANEVLHVDNPADLQAEIADVLEVIDHIIEYNGFQLEDIQKIRLAKQIKNGKFQKRLKVIYVDMDKNNSNIEYYTKQPDKYPEMPID